MEINYQDIGIRIREYRLQKKLTQDKLAEQVNLSPPHMSHIERGTTKVSLPTLINIADVLGCSMDALLSDSLLQVSVPVHNEIAKELDDCSDEEIRIIRDMVKTLKKSLRKHKHTSDRSE